MGAKRSGRECQTRVSLRQSAKRTGVKRRPAAVVPSRDSKGLAQAAKNFSAKVADFEISDPGSADLAGRWRLEIDAQERKIVGWFAPAKHAAFKAHALICRQENEALAPYRVARRMIDAKLATWMRDQGATGATRRVAHSDSFHSEEISESAAAMSGTHVAGVNFRENWRIEVVDKLALVKAIAVRPELLNLVDPNLTALGHLARAHKNALELPGIRVWRELTVAASPRR